MTPQEKILLGARAETLLNDPAFAAAVEQYQAELFQRWKDTTETSARETLWHECRALEGVTARLSALKLAGTVAKNRT